jgi:predicted transcriptional regulator
LDKRIKDDQDVYAYALLKTNGLTPGDNAKVIAAVWERYVERPLTVDDVAREMGTTAEQLRTWIKDKEDKEGILDPILLALSKEGNRAMTLRREYVEEMWPVLMRLKK